MSNSASHVRRFFESLAVSAESALGTCTTIHIIFTSSQHGIIIMQDLNFIWKAGCAVCLLGYQGTLPDDAAIHRLSLAFGISFADVKQYLSKSSEGLRARGEDHLYSSLLAILVAIHDALGRQWATQPDAAAAAQFSHLIAASLVTKFEGVRSVFTRDQHERNHGADAESNDYDNHQDDTQLITTQDQGPQAQKVYPFVCTFRCGAKFEKKTWWRRS